MHGAFAAAAPANRMARHNTYAYVLSTGGLVRAYAQAAQAGIEAAELVVVSRGAAVEGRSLHGDMRP